MARQKLSEYRAKQILFKSLDVDYPGQEIYLNDDFDDELGRLDGDSFVVKVDEGVKGRFKKGLVALNVANNDLRSTAESMHGKGYSWLIVEPSFEHDQSQERYLNLSSNRSGLTLSYSTQGGIDIEDNASSIQSVKINDDTDYANLSQATAVGEQALRELIQAFRDNYFVFLEINPYVVDNNGIHILDAAVEVDDAADFFVNTWQSDDFRNFTGQALTEEEKVVRELDENSPASLNLSVLNPQGSVFLLLSGGGASVVVADEVYNQGYGEQLANYGEYSGNPNAEETYMYTKQLLSLLLKSGAQHKVIFIGGAVANFTDVAKTFTGVIKAIEEVADKLKEQSVKIFVRRGGPNQEDGLAKIQASLEKSGLFGAVHDPSTPLTVAVSEALQELKDA